MAIIYKKGDFVKVYVNVALGFDPEHVEGQGIKKGGFIRLFTKLRKGRCNF